MKVDELRVELNNLLVSLQAYDGHDPVEFHLAHPIPFRASRFTVTRQLPNVALVILRVLTRSHY